MLRLRPCAPTAQRTGGAPLPFDDVDEWLTCDDSAHLLREHLFNTGFKRRGVPSHVRCDECVWGSPQWVFVWQGFGVNHVERCRQAPGA